MNEDTKQDLTCGAGTFYVEKETNFPEKSAGLLWQGYSIGG